MINQSDRNPLRRAADCVSEEQARLHKTVLTSGQVIGSSVIDSDFVTC